MFYYIARKSVCYIYQCSFVFSPMLLCAPHRTVHCAICHSALLLDLLESTLIIYRNAFVNDNYIPTCLRNFSAIISTNTNIALRHEKKININKSIKTGEPGQNDRILCIFCIFGAGQGNDDLARNIKFRNVITPGHTYHHSRGKLLFGFAFCTKIYTFVCMYVYVFVNWSCVELS